MGMPIATIGASTTGHGCWPPTTICKGSKNFIVQGLPAAFISCAAIPHTCTNDPHPTHGLSVASGSSTVIINGLPAARIGDSMTCGDIIAVGKNKTIVGG